jgi:MtN3 and saliva related transmembrane protein
MFLLMCSGIICWFLYGLLKNDMPIIIANGVTIIFAGSILYFKLRYK